MLYEHTGLAKAIVNHSLPTSLTELFGDLYDEQNCRFLMQETTIIDFKESIPDNFTKPYGVGILRLAIAFHNAYGGLIVFGVVVIDTLSASGHDVDMEVAEMLIEPLKRLAPSIGPSALKRVTGLARRSFSGLSKIPRALLSQQGFTYILQNLQDVINSLDDHIKKASHK
jgi:hypothetical protein